MKTTTVKKIRVAIVDDEPLARSRISNLLQNQEDIQCVAECKNGTEAIKFIQKKQPDLLFLDIQMPDMNGFEVVNQLDMVHLPIIIFVTAYDRYALRAFDVHAMDYLLKPFDNERFYQALALAKQQIHLRASSAFQDKFMRLFKEYQFYTSAGLEVFQIKEKGRNIFVDLDEIFWIESYGNYVKLHLDKNFHVYRATMNSIEEELNPEQFLRIHRSYILHTQYIEKVQYLNNNEYQFILKNGVKVTSSRSYKEKIQQFLMNQEAM